MFQVEFDLANHWSKAIKAVFLRPMTPTLLFFKQNLFHELNLEAKHCQTGMKNSEF